MAKVHACYLNKSGSIEIVSNYFQSESTSYGFKFSEMVRQRQIDFNPRYYSHFDHTRQKVFIQYTRTLDDAFALTHESKHFMNYLPNKSFQEEIFSETSSILSELRLGEYLKQTSLKRATELQIKNILYDNYNSFEEIKRNLKCVRIKDYDHKEVNSRIKYLIGLLLSIYINRHIKLGNITTSGYEKIRDHLENMPLSQLAHILDIDINLDNNILNISEGGLLKLEDSYKLEMSSLFRKEDKCYEKCRNCG
ncbi:MAG: hypothetical protein E7169_01070 [Firmicutes bacterium]|nr:hypothetical protein [Bacillota bacterium]